MNKAKVDPENERLKTLKAFALNSGFPLENDVHDIVRQLSFTGNLEVIRPESFVTINEENEQVVRSVDFRVTLKNRMKTIPHSAFPIAGQDEGASITFLIDAKFTSSDAWWFIPEIPKAPPMYNEFFPFLLPVYSDTGANWDISAKMLPAFEISSGWLRATSGKKISISKKNNEQQNDRDSLTQYQTQMNQAVLSRLNQQFGKIGIPTPPDNKYFHNIEVIFPIIVTNAPLYMMSTDISSKLIETSTSETQIAKQEQVLLLNQQPIARIQQALRNLELNIENQKSGKFSWKKTNTTDFPVFVVNIHSLGSLMTRLIQRFEQHIPNELK